MPSYADRVEYLFGTDEARTLLAQALSGFKDVPFSELARAVRDCLRDLPPSGVGSLARELRRAGLSIHQANVQGQHAGDDAAQLIEYTRTGCD